MKTTSFRLLMVLSALALLGASSGIALELTFEARIQAQEAIERVSLESGVPPYSLAVRREGSYGAS